MVSRRSPDNTAGVASLPKDLPPLCQGPACQRGRWGDRRRGALGAGTQEDGGVWNGAERGLTASCGSGDKEPEQGGDLAAVEGSQGEGWEESWPVGPRRAAGGNEGLWGLVLTGAHLRGPLGRARGFGVSPGRGAGRELPLSWGAGAPSRVEAQTLGHDGAAGQGGPYVQTQKETMPRLGWSLPERTLASGVTSGDTSVFCVVP